MAEIITNSDLDLNTVITITEPVRVVGSNGTIRYFLPFKQYCFCSTVILDYDQSACDAREWCKKTVTYYIHTADDLETFNIPEYACCIENKLRAEFEQDLRLNREERNAVYNPTDWREELERVVGISPIEGVHCNGMNIYKKDPSTGRISEQEAILKRLRSKGNNI